MKEGHVGFEIGIFEKTFPRPTFAETLDAVSEHGLRFIQLHLETAGLEPMPTTVPESTRRLVKEEITRRGIAVAALSATYNMAHPDPAVRTDGLVRLEAMAAACGDLGTTVLTLCTGTRDPDDKWRQHPDNAAPDTWADLSVSIRSALEIAERHGVTLAVEPEPANVVRDASAARRLLDEMASPRLKIILDPANIVAGALDRPPADALADAFHLLGEEIVVAHAKDVDATGRFRPAGSGLVPLPTYLALLRASGFPGPLILHSLSEEDVPRCLEVLRTAMLPPLPWERGRG